MSTQPIQLLNPGEGFDLFSDRELELWTRSFTMAVQVSAKKVDDAQELHTRNQAVLAALTAEADRRRRPAQKEDAHAAS